MMTGCEMQISPCLPTTNSHLSATGPPSQGCLSHSNSVAATEQSDTKDESFAGSSDQKGSDSGYASIRNTPTREYVKSDGHISATKGKLKSFNKDISEAHRQRFADLQELLVADLRRFMVKKFKGKQDYGTIAWRLKCLGETEESACPWIVILCDKSVAETVRKYLKKSQVKDQCRPSDDSLPSFDVRVCAISLQDLAAPFVFCEHVYADLAGLITLCGTAVSNVDGDKARSATLGGVVKIEKEGSTQFLGMTAGHIFDSQLVQKSLSPRDLFDYDDCDSDNDDDLEDDKEEDDELELDLEEICADSNPIHLWEANNKLRQSSDSYPSIIGLTHYRSSSAVLQTGRDLDWTLFGVEHALPNLLKIDTNSAPVSLHKASDLQCEEVQPGTSVWILTSHGTIAGVLQPSAFLLRASAKESIDTFVVKTIPRDIDEGVASLGEPIESADRLHVGDSGSWVVTQESEEVIGYVLASDVFGDVYVVPFKSALDDIKRITNANSCGLFSEDDLRHYKQSASNTTTMGTASDTVDSSVLPDPEIVPQRALFGPNDSPRRRFNVPAETPLPLAPETNTRAVRFDPFVRTGVDSGYMSRHVSIEPRLTKATDEPLDVAGQALMPREIPPYAVLTTSRRTGIDSGYSSTHTSPPAQSYNPFPKAKRENSHQAMPSSTASNSKQPPPQGLPRNIEEAKELFRATSRKLSLMPTFAHRSRDRSQDMTGDAE